MEIFQLITEMKILFKNIKRKLMIAQNTKVLKCCVQVISATINVSIFSTFKIKNNKSFCSSIHHIFLGEFVFLLCEKILFHKGKFE